jgi:hypothetical protein
MSRITRSRWLSILLSFALFFGLSLENSFSAEPVDSFDVRYLPTGPDEFYFTVMDPGSSFYSTTSIQPPGVGLGETRGDWHTCSSLSDPKCVGRDRDLASFVVLGLCENANQEDCVVGLEISRSQGEYRPLEFARHIQSNLVQERDESRGFPGGTTASIWRESGDPTSQYLVSVGYIGGFWNDGRFALTQLNFNIYPVRIVTGSYEGAKMFPEREDYTRVRWGSDGRALWTEDGLAGFRTDFDPGTRFKLTSRVRTGVSGWYKGRIKDPNVEISKFSSTNDLITISGEPVSVAVMGVKRKVSDMSAKEFRWFQNMGRINNASPVNPDNAEIFDYISHFKEEAGDAALGVTTTWSIGSTTWGNRNTCLNDTSRVLGIVSTNSMGFDGDSPQFIDGGLEYRVASVHYGPDRKTPLQGTYDLVLRSDVARCLYGFSNAPVSASISIQGSDGQASISTSSMTEANGWLKFGAYGFTFSEKKIRVALTQEKLESGAGESSEADSATTTSPVVATEKTAPKSKKLTCFKKKKVKEFSDRTQCPKGFKKVAGKK